MAHAALQNVQPSIEILVANHQRAQNLHHFRVGATGFNDQAFVEASTDDFFRNGTVTAAQALHHAPALRLEYAVTTQGGNACEAVGKQLALALNFLGKAVVFPIGLDGCSSGYEGMVIPAEGAVVFARRPLIVFRLEQDDGKWKTETGKRLRQRHDVRFDASRFKAEEGARAAAACLDIVDDQ